MRGISSDVVTTLRAALADIGVERDEQLLRVAFCECIALTPRAAFDTRKTDKTGHRCGNVQVALSLYCLTATMVF